MQAGSAFDWAHRKQSCRPYEVSIINLELRNLDPQQKLSTILGRHS